MAGKSTNRPAWAQSMEAPAGHSSSGDARTASVRGGGPCPRRARGGRRDSPSEETMTHTLWWLMGVPSAVRASAISFTDLSRARIASTLSRRLAVLRGPLGPGLEETKNWNFAGPQVGGHLVHRRLRVPEAGSGHLGRLALNQVGPQGFVPALGRVARAREEL